jgi:hypothetical protein
MSRLVQRKIEVHTDKRGDPVAFVDRDVSHVVTQVIDAWRESGEWWKGEPPHHVFRVMAHDGLYDIEEVGEEWFLYRVWD